jgi:hypothetical protein
MLSNPKEEYPMVPCCARSERQYLNKDHTLSEAFLRKNFSESAIAIERDDTESEWGKLVFAKRQFYPSLLIVVDGDTETQLCRCACHLEGSMVMH